MSEFQENESGILMPVPPPAPKPKRRYSMMELQDEESREAAKKALGALAYAMDLVHGTGGIAGIELQPDGDFAARRRQSYGAFHRHLGELLLGDDYEGWEEYT